MGIFFIRLVDDGNSAKSIAFSCEYPTVADLTEAFFDDEIVSGYRCEWKWDSEHRHRQVVRRTGLTLASARVAAIEEPHVRFVDMYEEDDWPRGD